MGDPQLSPDGKQVLLRITDATERGSWYDQWYFGKHGPLGGAIFGAPTAEPWHGFDTRRRIVEFL
jgi:hypothetical protein